MSIMWLSNRNKQVGLALLTYLLFAVFLFGALGAMVAKSRWGGNAAEKQWGATMDMVNQANLIRSKLLDCSTGAGNNGTANNPSFPAATTAKVITDATLLCPANSTQLMSGADGIFLPPAPGQPDFNDWAYTNTANCVRVDLIAKSATAATQWNKAMTDAVAKLGASVASIVTTTSTNDTLRVVIVKSGTTCP